MNVATSKKVILIHVLVWCSYMLLSWVQFYIDFKDVPAQFYFERILNIVIFYLNFLWLVPRFLLKRNLKLYYIGVALILLCNGIINRAFYKDFRSFKVSDRVEHAFFKKSGDSLLVNSKNDSLISHRKDIPFPDSGKIPVFDAHEFNRHKSWIFEYVMPNIVPLLLIALGGIIKVYSEWRSAEDHKKDIAAKKVSSELQFLKAQLNPHFLFNSLNTIYSLSVSKSTETPEAVLHLSEMMRYMLYEADKDMVLLEKELDYLQNYIELQRLRLVDGRGVTFNVHGDYYHKKIQPLLFVSFVENAFKYGTDFTGKTEVKIVITVQDNRLHFYCENIMGGVVNDLKNSGIGLENIISRLNLLYPDAHKLTTAKENNKFIVNLYIQFK